MMKVNRCPACYASAAAPGTCHSCGFNIPAEWLTTNQLAIAFTGARTAGKSVLVAVMMDQFEYFLENQHRSFLTPVGDTDERFKEKYRLPLYEQRRLLPPTPRADKESLEPLIWTFQYGGHPFCLSIIDAAGEDFESLAPTDERFRYLGLVDFIMALVDPLKVGDIGAIFEGRATLPTGSGHDVDVLRAVLRARGSHRNEASPSQVLGIVLSKFDVLQQLRHANVSPWQSIMNRPGSTLQRDPSMVSRFDDPEDAALLGQELRGVLAQMRAEQVLAAAEEAQIPYRLFATSALGSPPDATAVGRGGITPFRVLDMLQAALTRKVQML